MPEPAEEKAEGGGAPVFIKKARKGNFRKKEKVDDEEESVDVRKAIEETRKEQKFRVRGAGVDAEKLATSATKSVKKVVVDEAEEPAGSALGSLLDSQFSAENEERTHYGQMEKQMLSYIDSKLSKGGAQDDEEEHKLTAEDELYQIPEDLELKEKAKDIMDNGAETWLTGIVEVELPMEDKLRNIEETEAAKKKILEERRLGISRGAFIVDTTSDKGYARVDGKKKDKRRKKDEPQHPDVQLRAMLPGSANQGTNFNQNFMSNRPTREVKEMGRGQEHQGITTGKKTEISSDDIVMERFKKRFRHKK